MPENKNTIWPYLTSAMFFLAGVAASLLLVRHFIVQPAHTEAPKKTDTVFVKLVDQTGFAPMPVQEKTEATLPQDTSKKKQDAQSGSAGIEGITIFPKQAGRRLSPNNPPPVVLASDEQAATLSTAYALRKSRSAPVIISLLAALLMLGVSFFSKKDKLINAQLTDKDPPELHDLFEAFKTEIVLFRNPRKILRFMNLVKYHYYFLSKNNISGRDNLYKMMRILLEIQKDSSLMSIDGVDPARLKDTQWFYERIKDKDWAKTAGIQATDTELMMIILKLNIDMGS